MEAPQVTRVLKADGFGRVELLAGPHGPVVRRVACGGRVPGAGFLARRLAARERRALRTLADLEGVARLVDDPACASAPSRDGRAPRRRDVLLRSWIPGVPLHAARALPRDFFERLEDLVHALHTRGVCHNDLHKEPNVLVRPDGRPALVDFQLASVHASKGRSFEARAREDLRHVAKHAHRYGQRGASGAAATPPRGSLAAAWMRLGKPLYNRLKRWAGATGRSEPRRPREGPWPSWTAPLGPGPGAPGRGSSPGDAGPPG